jgi:hypothetical protein
MNVVAKTASNEARIKVEDVPAVKAILEKYVVRGDLTLKLERLRSCTEFEFLWLRGDDSVDVYKIDENKLTEARIAWPEDQSDEEIDPRSDDFDYDKYGIADSLEALMLEVAPYLQDNWYVQQVSMMGWSLAAHEWSIKPCALKVNYMEFTHGRDPTREKFGTVVIEVSGGNVQEVYIDDTPLIVYLVDWDNIKDGERDENGDYVEGGVEYPAIHIAHMPENTQAAYEKALSQNGESDTPTT